MHLSQVLRASFLVLRSVLTTKNEEQSEACLTKYLEPVALATWKAALLGADDAVEAGLGVGVVIDELELSQEAALGMADSHPVNEVG